MTINHIFTTCQNIEYHANFVVFDSVWTYTDRTGEVYRGEWEDMPDAIANACVAKFCVEDAGNTVFVWIIRR